MSDPVAENFARIALWDALVAPAIDRGFITGEVESLAFYAKIEAAHNAGGEDAAQSVFDKMEAAATAPMSVTQIAAELGISPATFRTYVMRGKAPRADGYFDKRTPYWHRSTIAQWRAGRGRATTTSLD